MTARAVVICPQCGKEHVGPCFTLSTPQGDWASATIGTPPRTPHRCPVCNGRGNLPHGFYNPNPTGLSGDTAEEQCRTCQGSGIVWSY